MIKLAKNCISGRRRENFVPRRTIWPSIRGEIIVSKLSVFTCPDHTSPAATNLTKYTALSVDIIQIVVLCWNTFEYT